MIGRFEISELRNEPVRLLLVEDEEGIGKFIAQGLEEAGHSVDWVKRGDSGLVNALKLFYDLIILDVMLPQLDGIAILTELRRSHISTPILMLTARDAIEDRVTGLNAGADDYLVKPFDFAELQARIAALMRRPPLQISGVLRIDDLEMDTARQIVRRGGKMLDLSQREFALLEYLIRNAGQVLTRSQIGESVWGFEFYDESNVVDVYIGYLRRKIDKGASHPLIKTIRGVGFQINSDNG